MSSSIIATSPGKVILFGEHAVVYGYPAIAVAIDRRAKVIVKESNTSHTILKAPNLYPSSKSFILASKSSIPDDLQALVFVIKEMMRPEKAAEITVRSEIPPRAGLGSSAAVAVAVVGALNHFYNHGLSIEEISNYAFEAEKIQHGKPSGIDNTISTYGGGIVYIKGEKKRIEININTPVVVANSFVERKTRILVEKVRRYYEKAPKRVKEIFESIKELVNASINALKAANIDKIGELMTLNHGFLNELGVSHPKLEKIIKIFKEHNSLGAKLTGAGGGGCAIALFADEESAKKAVKSIRNSGMDAFITSFSEKGLLYNDA